MYEMYPTEWAEPDPEWPAPKGPEPDAIDAALQRMADNENLPTSVRRTARRLVEEGNLLKRLLADPDPAQHRATVKHRVAHVQRFEALCTAEGGVLTLDDTAVDCPACKGRMADA